MSTNNSARTHSGGHAGLLPPLHGLRKGDVRGWSWVSSQDSRTDLGWPLGGQARLGTLWQDPLWDGLLPGTGPPGGA